MRNICKWNCFLSRSSEEHTIIANVHIFKEGNSRWWILETKKLRLLILSQTVEVIKEYFMNRKESSDPQMPTVVHGNVIQSPKVSALPCLWAFSRYPLSLGYSSLFFKKAGSFGSFGSQLPCNLLKESFPWSFIFLSQHSVLFLHSTYLKLKWCICYFLFLVSAYPCKL